LNFATADIYAQLARVLEGVWRLQGIRTYPSPPMKQQL
jgi:hypothetical protein